MDGVSAGSRAERRAPTAGGWLHGQVLQPNWGGTSREEEGTGANGWGNRFM